VKDVGLRKLATVAASVLALGTAGAAGLGLTATAAQAAAEYVQRVENFKLSDQHGRAHELHKLADAKAIVLMTQGNSCPIVRNVMPALKELRAAYGGQGVEFLMINSNIQDDPSSIQAEATEFDFNQIPILKDADQAVGEKLGVTRTAEVFVINPKTWQVAYRGPIDDRVVYERQKAKADHTWAKDAIDAVLQGKKPAVTEQQPMGCIINFPNRDKVG
jgi:peroxiredoxin